MEYGKKQSIIELIVPKIEQTMKVNLNDYYYFVHVVEKQGYTAAANALQMPKSRLSRHVAQLEERLGVRLLQRTSRNVTVTESGKRFYQHARKCVDAMEFAESAMQNAAGELSGKVIISCSTGLTQFAFGDLCIEFAKKHPSIEIEQRISNAYVDMVAEGVDMAIRGHSTSLPDSNLIQRPIANVDWPLYCAPNYLNDIESIKTPRDLSKCAFLKIGRVNAQNAIRLIHDSGQEVMQTITPRFCSEDMASLKQAAISGLGITSLPKYVCQQDVLSGDLIQVLPAWLTQSAQLSLVMPSRLGVPKHIHLFAEYIREHLPAIVRAC